MDSFQQQILDAAARMGISIAPTKAVEAVAVKPTEQQPRIAPVVPVDPPLMKPEWEKEIDDAIAARGGRFDIKLPSGATIRITPDPKPATDAVEVSHEMFKKLSRAASIMNGRVLDIMTQEQADARTDAIIKKGEGCWIAPNIFVEVDKFIDQGSGRSDFGIIAAPKPPPSTLQFDPMPWLVLSASSIVDQVPMRVAGGKVIGTLIKTIGGPLYARQVKDTDHKLNIQAAWAMSGGYTIEREVYDKYLTDPTTVIKMVRSDRVYLTTSAWVQAYGGIIVHWGTERVVMPLSGNYWLVVNKNGEIIS